MKIYIATVIKGLIREVYKALLSPSPEDVIQIYTLVFVNNYSRSFIYSNPIHYSWIFEDCSREYCNNLYIICPFNILLNKLTHS